MYQYIANSFFKNGDQTIDDANLRSGVMRLTWQLNQKNKVAAYLDRIRKFRGHENSSPAGYAIAEEATDIRSPKQYYTTEAKWTSTVSSKLLLEAGLAINNESYTLEAVPEGVGQIPRRDTILQTAYGAYDGGFYYREPIRRTLAASASYVTGSHAFKAGLQYGWGYFWRQRSEVADLIQLYRTRVPAQVIIHNTPQDSYQAMNADQGLYVQDSWTVGRFTINPGVRFEHFNSSIEARDLGAGRFVPGRHFDRRADLPNWHDIAPRFGFAWDIQGNGKTAVKFGSGKYVRAYSTGFAEAYRPELLQRRHPDVERPEQGRCGARHAGVRLPGRGVRDRLLHAAGDLRRQAKPESCGGDPASYDVGFNSRMRGLTIFGGVSMGRQVSNTCQVEDSNFLRYCDQAEVGIPYYTQVKLNGSYQLPWRVSVSGSLQSYPGDARNPTADGLIVAEDPSLRVNWSVDRTLFRSLTGATLTQSAVVVPLIAPGTKLLGRQNQLDIRFKRLFTIKGMTLEAQADAYNALNTGVVLTAVQTFGSALDRPATILQGRLFRFGMQARW